ncbi:DgyrCDS13222 [Dimorphilus gyrociliatus]|uniref:DgyrCDS13222 n=1 Tax=Dimorphilus gyrociliatus TaxID=2664684 RepID=A0A7I8WA15_9ANNE|nr:DgyrCDS13222 [Dimorphilus gyrociliatus]
MLDNDGCDENFFEKPTRAYPHKKHRCNIRTGNTIRTGKSSDADRLSNKELVRKWIVFNNNDITVDESLNNIEGNHFIIHDSLVLNIARNPEEYGHSDPFFYSLNKQKRWLLDAHLKNKYLCGNSYSIGMIDKTTVDFRRRGQTFSYTNSKGLSRSAVKTFSHDKDLYVDYLCGDDPHIQEFRGTYDFEILYEMYRKSPITSYQSTKKLQKKPKRKRRCLPVFKHLIDSFINENSLDKESERQIRILRNLRLCQQIEIGEKEKRKENILNKPFAIIPKEALSSFIKDSRSEDIAILDEYSTKPLTIMLDFSKRLSKGFKRKNVSECIINNFIFMTKLELTECPNSSKDIVIKLENGTNLQCFPNSNIQFTDTIKVKSFRKLLGFLIGKYSKWIHQSELFSLIGDDDNLIGKTNTNDNILFRNKTDKIISNWLLSFINCTQESISIKQLLLNDQKEDEHFKLLDKIPPVEFSKDLTFICAICYSKNDGYGLKCGHRFCKDCWMRSDINNTECILTECKEKIPLPILISMYGFHHYFTTKKRRSLEKIYQLGPRCRNNECCMVFIKNCNNSMGILECDCGEFFCCICKLDCHWPLNCKENSIFEKIIQRIEYKESDNWQLEDEITVDDNLSKAIKAYDSFKRFNFKVVKCKAKFIAYRWRCSSQNPQYNRRRQAFSADLYAHALKSLQFCYITLYRADYLTCYCYLLQRTKKYNIIVKDIIQQIELARLETKKLIKCTEEMMDFNETIIKRLNSLCGLLEDSLKKLVFKLLKSIPIIL